MRWLVALLAALVPHARGNVAEAHQEAEYCLSAMKDAEWSLRFLTPRQFCEPVALLVHSDPPLTSTCLDLADELLDLALQPSEPASLFRSWSEEEKHKLWQEPLTWSKLEQARARPLTLWPIHAEQTLQDFLGYSGPAPSPGRRKKNKPQPTTGVGSVEQLDVAVSAGSLLAVFVPDLSATSYTLTLFVPYSSAPAPSLAFQLQVGGDVGVQREKRQQTRGHCGPSLAFNAPSAWDLVLVALPGLASSLHRPPPPDASLPRSVEQVMARLAGAAHASGPDLSHLPPVWPVRTYRPNSKTVYSLPCGRHGPTAEMPGPDWPIAFIVLPSRAAARFQPWVQAELPTMVVLHNLQLNARLLSQRAIASAQVGSYAPELGGYPVHVDTREPGPFRLQVALSWLYGAAEDKWAALRRPPPLPDRFVNHRLGHYSNHVQRDDEARRMMVTGSGMLVHFFRPARSVRPGNHTSDLPVCDVQSWNNPGRWLYLNLTAAARDRAARVLPDESVTDEDARQLFFADMEGGVSVWRGRNALLPYAFFRSQGECQPEVCTGEHEGAFITDGVHSGNNMWIYTPYGCSVRLFSKSQILRCSTAVAMTRQRQLRARQGIKAYEPWVRPRDTPLLWIHFTGDSTLREVASFFFDKFKVKSFTSQDSKYEEKEGTWGKFGRLKVTYRSPYLDREDPDWSWKEDLELHTRQDYNLDLSHGPHRPDVWVVDAAWAYSSWQQPLQSLQRWLDHFIGFLTYLQHASPELKPLRVIWHEPLWVFSPAHANTHNITLERTLARANLARQRLQRECAWVEFHNATSISMSRWEHESFDGLHFLDRSYGAVSAMVAHVFLNGLFPPDCEQPLHLTNQEKIFKQEIASEVSAELQRRQDEYEAYERLTEEGPHELEVGICVRLQAEESSWLRVFTLEECEKTLHGWRADTKVALGGQEYIECLAAEGGSHSWNFGRHCYKTCESCGSQDVAAPNHLACTKPEHAARSLLSGAASEQDPAATAACFPIPPIPPDFNQAL